MWFGLIGRNGENCKDIIAIQRAIEKTIDKNLKSNRGKQQKELDPRKNTAALLGRAEMILPIIILPYVWS